ncbi:DNA polymerase [Izhakiella capsodis]|uniref:DNA polymerase n=1 Tax=Izhakiella capsodis TaxID=1367852 RepID=A0A1I4X4Z4_9GAMM|nr:DNA polymerase [Izhakiella capsodis]
MRENDKKLPGLNYSGHELALWHRDQRINDRSFSCDVALAESTVIAVREKQKAWQNERNK